MPNNTISKKRGPKKAQPVSTIQLCHYCCGHQAKFINNSGKLMCEDSANKCPQNKLKNSDNLKESYKNGRPVSDFGNKQGGWSKGLTKETDDRVLKHAKLLSGKRKISDLDKLEKTIYKEQCSFNLAGIIERVIGYDLLKKHGMYNRKENLGGVVRDHRISVEYGFKNNIDPKIISHPANCEFLLHVSNARKTFKNSCSLEQLMEDIEKWDREGNLVYLVE